LARFIRLSVAQPHENGIYKLVCLDACCAGLKSPIVAE